MALEVVARYKDEGAGPGLDGLAAKIRANIQASKQFGEAQQSGVNQALDSFVPKLKAATAATGVLTSTLKTAAREGLQDVVGRGNIVAGVLGDLVGKVSGFGGAILGVVGVGAALISYLKQLQAEAEATNRELNKINQSIVSTFGQAILETKRIQAEASGDVETAAALTAQKQIQAAEDTKRAKITAAQESGKSESEIIGLVAQAEVEAVATRIVAIEEFHAKVAALEKQKLALSQETNAALLASQQELSAAQQAAAGNDLGALTTATAAKIALIDQEKAAKLAQIDVIFKNSVLAVTEREKVEAAAINRVIALETEAATRRKALLDGFVSTALGSLAKLGPGFEDLTKKLTIQKSLSEAQKELQAFDQLLQANKITAAEAAQATRGITDALSGMGAKATEIAQIVPKSLEEAAAAAKRLSTSAFEVAGAFFQTRAAAEDYARSLNIATTAVRNLENEQTENSLDDSTRKVAGEFGFLSQKVEEAIALMNSMTSKTAAAAAGFDGLAASASKAGNAVGSIPEAPVAGPGGGTLTATGNPNQQMSGPSGSFDLSFLLANPEIGRSRVPGTSDSLLEFTLRQLKAQRRAQQRVQEFLEGQFAEPSMGGIGSRPEPTDFPEFNGPGRGTPRRDRSVSAGPGGVTIVNNTNVEVRDAIIDSDRRVYDLSGRIASEATDRQRRRI